MIFFFSQDYTVSIYRAHKKKIGEVGELYFRERERERGEFSRDYDIFFSAIVDASHFAKIGGKLVSGDQVSSISNKLHPYEIFFPLSFFYPVHLKSYFYTVAEDQTNLSA